MLINSKNNYTIFTIILLIASIFFFKNGHIFALTIITLYTIIIILSHNSNIIKLYLLLFYFMYIFEFVFFTSIDNEVITNVFNLITVYFIGLIFPILFFSEKINLSSDKFIINFQHLKTFLIISNFLFLIVNIFLLLNILDITEIYILHIEYLGQIIKKYYWLFLLIIFITGKKGGVYINISLFLLLLFICFQGYSRFELIILCFVAIFKRDIKKFKYSYLLIYGVLFFLIFSITPYLKSLYYNQNFTFDLTYSLDSLELIMAILSRISYSHEFVIFYIKQYSINPDNIFRLIQQDTISKLDIGIIPNSILSYNNFFFIESLIISSIILSIFTLFKNYEEKNRIEIFFFIFIAQNSSMNIKYIYLDLIFLIFLTFLIKIISKVK